MQGFGVFWRSMKTRKDVADVSGIKGEVNGNQSPFHFKAPNHNILF